MLRLNGNNPHLKTKVQIAYDYETSGLGIGDIFKQVIDADNIIQKKKKRGISNYTVTASSIIKEYEKYLKYDASPKIYIKDKDIKDINSLTFDKEITEYCKNDIKYLYDLLKENRMI